MRLVGGMGRDERHGLARGRHLLVLGVRDLGVAEQSVARDAVEHAVARALRRFGVAVRPAVFRRLGQCDEERRLAERETARLLAEIGEGSRPYTFEIAA